MDASQGTLENVQHVHDHIQDYLSTPTVSPDPKKNSIGSQLLASFQNCQWIYALLQNVWTAKMKLIIKLCYQELHN